MTQQKTDHFYRPGSRERSLLDGQTRTADETKGRGEDMVAIEKLDTPGSPRGDTRWLAQEGGNLSIKNITERVSRMSYA